MDEKELDDISISLSAWEEGMAKFAECIVWFQYIEHTLSICIFVLADMDEEIGEVVVSQMSFKARVATLSALASHLAPNNELNDDISELFKRVRWAEQERNRLVHSMWDLSEEAPGTIDRRKASIKRNRHRIDEESFVPDDFEELQRLFEGINTDLVYLLSNHYPDYAEKFHY